MIFSLLIAFFYYNNQISLSFYYRAAIGAEVVPDIEEEVNDGNIFRRREAAEYVEVVDPFAPEISFLKSECPQRRVIKIVCDQLGGCYYKIDEL